jgi:uncharacterized membrane protein YbjE (DUF340 family)
MKDILITLGILICIISGIFLGATGLVSVEVISRVDSLAWWLLELLIFLVGIDLGINHIWKRLKTVGYQMLALPMAVVIGSFIGGIMATLLLGFPFMKGMCLTGGLGWYSLTSVLMDKWMGPEMGALAFLSNVIREMLTMLCFPLLHRMRLTVPGIAMGGATTMDSTLILINRVGGAEYAFIAFFQGLIITLIVPFLVPFLAIFCK